MAPTEVNAYYNSPNNYIGRSVMRLFGTVTYGTVPLHLSNFWKPFIRTLCLLCAKKICDMQINIET